MPAATPPPCLGRAYIAINFQYKFIVKEKTKTNDISTSDNRRHYTCIYIDLYIYVYTDI